jgi:hypothetical protein
MGCGLVIPWALSAVYHDGYGCVGCRDIVRQQAPTNKEIAAIISRGELLPDKIVNDIVFTTLSTVEASVILDGRHLWRFGITLIRYHCCVYNCRLSTNTITGY